MACESTVAYPLLTQGPIPAVPQGPEPTLSAEPIEAGAEPSRERGGNGRLVEADIRQVIASLTSRPQRDPVTQQFVAGNVDAGKSLEHSAQLWAALAPAKRELVEQVKADRGVNGESATTFTGLVDAYAEVTLLRKSMFIRLADLGGPITTKGKARALYGAYLGALDREVKLAQVIGLERRPKPVASPLDYIQGRTDDL